MKKLLLGFVIVTVMAGGLFAVSRHSAPSRPVTVPTKSYVALGDSVAAGIGLSPYSDASACNRTDQAYPKIIAQTDSYKLTSLACSGATMAAGINGPQTVNDLAVRSQLDQLFGLPKSMQIRQISITIGANDMGWTDILTRCYATVCGTEADTSGVDARLATVTNNMQTVLQKISDHYGASVPPVIVTGYYQLLPAALANCPEMTGLDASELQWERSQEDKLNATLQASVVGHPFARYAAIDFSGHELCTADSWVQNSSAPAPFHPTAAGQREYARKYERILK